MPEIPARYELSPEEYRSIQDRFQKFGDDFVAYVAEMQVYKYDTDGQLSDQYSRLDEGKADRQSISERLAGLRNDHESWKSQSVSNDKTHSDKLTQLSSKDTELAGTIQGVKADVVGKTAELSALIQGIRTDVNTASSNVVTLGTANKRQDERMDQLEARCQAIEAKNNNQDSATDALSRQIGNLGSAIQALSDASKQLSLLIQDLDTRMKKIEAGLPRP